MKYDGKIATLTFADDYCIMLLPNQFCENFINRRSRSAQRRRHCLCICESTLFTHNGEVFEKSKLYEENSNNIAVVAFDKYGKSKTIIVGGFEFRHNRQSACCGRKWTILSFLGTSTSPVMVSIVLNMELVAKLSTQPMAFT